MVTTQRELLKAKDMAKRLGVTVNLLNRWARQDMVPRIALPSWSGGPSNRAFRFDPVDVVEALKNLDAVANGGE